MRDQYCTALENLGSMKKKFALLKGNIIQQGTIMLHGVIIYRYECGCGCIRCGKGERNGEEKYVLLDLSS